ncbi:MAG: DUF3524 domain-containing protein [Bdellovibrionota bacterium]
MKILILEPFYTGSHKLWADGLKQHSAHEIELLTLPARYWKWRMHGAALTLGREFLEQNLTPDLILASDMLDLTSFQSITRKVTHDIPCFTYFHENQLTYPWSPDDRSMQHGVNYHYGFINFTSAVVADKVYFNSEYHRQEFISALTPFLKSFRDYHELSLVKTIEEKSGVLPVGLDLVKLHAGKQRGLDLKEKISGRGPLILWNHRWEHDKNPLGFIELINRLLTLNLDFQLAVLGDQPGNETEEVKAFRKKLGSKIVHWGFVENRSDYISWLWAADIIPLTSIHDFFGISVIEAVYCNTYPILPSRLSYPEIFAGDIFADCFYQTEEELYEKTKAVLFSAPDFNYDQSSKLLNRYDIKEVVKLYDEEINHGAIEDLK